MSIPPVNSHPPVSGPRPRLSRWMAAVAVVAGLAVAGSLVGALWAWMAPTIHGVVALTKSGLRVHTYLGDEADHFFVAAARMTGMLSGVAVVAAVLIWQWRAHRGPGTVAALWIGGAGAAAAAAGVGAALAHWRYGSVVYETAPVTQENRVYYFTEAPAVFFGHAPLQIAATLLLPGALAALVYSLLAAATPRDDLGAWTPTARMESAPMESERPQRQIAPGEHPGNDSAQSYHAQVGERIEQGGPGGSNDVVVHGTLGEPVDEPPHGHGR